MKRYEARRARGPGAMTSSMQAKLRGLRGKQGKTDKKPQTSLDLLANAVADTPWMKRTVDPNTHLPIPAELIETNRGDSGPVIRHLTALHTLGYSSTFKGTTDSLDARINYTILVDRYYRDGTIGISDAPPPNYPKEPKRMKQAPPSKIPVIDLTVSPSELTHKDTPDSALRLIKLQRLYDASAVGARLSEMSKDAADKAMGARLDYIVAANNGLADGVFSYSSPDKGPSHTYERPAPKSAFRNHHTPAKPTKQSPQTPLVSPSPSLPIARLTTPISMPPPSLPVSRLTPPALHTALEFLEFVRKLSVLNLSIGFHHRFRGANALECGMSPEGVAFITPEMASEYKIPAGVEGTLALDGKQNFIAVFHGIPLGDAFYPDTTKHLYNFEDPRDCGMFLNRMHMWYTKIITKQELMMIRMAEAHNEKTIEEILRSSTRSA